MKSKFSQLNAIWLFVISSWMQVIQGAEQVALPLVAGAERIAKQFISEGKYDRNYRIDLALEALLELSEATGNSGYREHTEKMIAKRGWTSTSDISFNGQSFTCLTFALFQASGDRDWLTVFLRESARCREKIERSPEGAVLHPRGRERGGGHAMLLDSMQEFVARMARAGHYSQDTSFYREAARQVRLYRQIVRDEKTGLWHQGRGWLGDRPQQLSPGAWSRGHGWLLRGMATALTEIPRDRPEYVEIRAAFVEIAEALLARQQPNGMWHCLLDRDPTSSPPESSGTAMIATAMSRAFRAGGIRDDRLQNAAMRAFRTLPKYIDAAGLVLSTSPGPGPLESEEKYLNVASFPPGNDHGTFALIFAATEALRLDRAIK